MNVNSRGHNLDTRFELFFPEIKHPPGLEKPVGASSPSTGLKSINTPRTDLRGAGQITGDAHCP
jgi:hypothetical protein